MILLFLACASPDVSVSPASLAWGEVDFHNADPADCDPDEGGCAPTVLTVLNNGSNAVYITVPLGVDETHLCTTGYEQGEPIDLGELPAGSSFNLEISVCGYEQGERDSEVSGTIDVWLDGTEAVPVPWSFTPVRNIAGDDTGS